MRIRSTSMRTVATVVATTAATVAIAGCGPAATGQAPADANAPMRAGAAPYQGDPWEARVRTAFWTEQHIHDSWNRCHIGENAAPAPGC